MYSADFTDDYTSDGITYSNYVNASSHQEVWTLSDNSLLDLNFLFINTRAGTSVTGSGWKQGSLSYAINRNNSIGTVYTIGIVDTVQSQSGIDLRDVLFSESGSFTLGSTADLSDSSGYLGVNYLGEGNYLYQYDSDSGYYYFDSCKNAAFYSGTRFYLYNYTIKVDRDSSETDFLPFNYNQLLSDKKVNQYYANYWFGMTSEIEFYLPDEVGDYIVATNTYGNQSTKDTDMVFRFMGDDDVWVYVDDTLVLDLGGIHGAIYGEINFSTGEIAYITNTEWANASETKTYAQLCFDQSSSILQYSDYVYERNNTLYIAVTDKETDNVQVVSEGTTGAEEIIVGYVTTYSITGANGESGAHTLDIYYMERGGTESNCAIWFNISSATYNLKLAKEDEEGISQSDKAEFTFYTDEDFTEVASLAKDQNGENIYSEFKSSETVYNLREGVTYYVKETTAPDGLTAAGRYFTECLKSGVLTITVYDSGGNVIDTYVYTITDPQDTNGTYDCNVTYTPEASTTDWKYVKQDSISVTATVTSEGTVSYYNIGFTVVNTAEYEIPSAGDMGIVLYLHAGTLLILIACIGLISTAFYSIVWGRRFRMVENKKGLTKEKAWCKEHHAKTRDHPRKRNMVRGRDAPETARSRGTGPGTK